jgi:hypothetical protein
LYHCHRRLLDRRRRHHRLPALANLPTALTSSSRGPPCRRASDPPPVNAIESVDRPRRGGGEIHAPPNNMLIVTSLLKPDAAALLSRQHHVRRPTPATALTPRQYCWRRRPRRDGSVDHVVLVSSSSAGRGNRRSLLRGDGASRAEAAPARAIGPALREPVPSDRQGQQRQGRAW